MAEVNNSEYGMSGKEVGSGASTVVGKPYEFIGGEPKFSYVGRTVTVDKALFESFKNKSKGRRSSGLFTAFLQPRDENEVVEDVNPSHRNSSMTANVWSGIVMALDATYTAFFVPILLAFLGGRGSNSVAPWYTYVELIAGCIFLVDIFMGFHIGFIIKYDYKKKIVMDSKSVVWYYRAHGGLWIDVASMVPLLLELAVQVASDGSQIANIATIFRIFRLVRLLKLIKNLYFTLFAGSIRRTPLLQHVPMGLIYSFGVLYTLAFMVNVLGCLLYFTAWAEDREFKGTWLDGNQGTDPENYLTSIYWAVTTITTVGYGDISPQTWIEQIIIMVLMITHIMLFGLLIGTMTEVLKSSSKRARTSEAYKTRIAEVGEWLQSRKVSSSMSKKVHAYYAEVWAQNSGFDEVSIFDELPRTLRNEIAFHITRDLLHGLSCFKEIDEKALTQLAGRLLPLNVPPGHEVVRQGDPADSLFILEEGTLIMQQSEEEINRLHGPATCGESTILGIEIPELSIRPVTLRARTSCHIWELKVKDIVPLFAHYPHLKTDLIEGYRVRMVQQFGRTSLGPSALEENLEAELGLDVTQSDAAAFKAQLDLTSTDDGTFPKLMKETLRRNHSRSRSNSITHFSSIDELQESSSFSHVLSSGYSDISSVLDHVHHELKKLGVNGMLELLQEMRTLQNPSGELSLVDFQNCIAGLGLPPHQLLSLFVHLDPMESGKVHVESFAELIRRRKQLDQPTLQYLEAIFFYLSSNGSEEVENTRLITSCHVEHHKDVLSGRQSGAEVLITFLTALKDTKIVTLKDFLTLNMDMAICMDDMNIFKKMVLNMWGVANGGILHT